MDNSQFINILARRLNVEPTTATRLAEGLADLLGQECRNLNRLAFPALGSFRGVKRDETVVRDLASGKRLLLPPTIELEFSAAGRLINGVAEGSAQS